MPHCINVNSLYNIICFHTAKIVDYRVTNFVHQNRCINVNSGTCNVCNVQFYINSYLVMLYRHTIISAHLCTHAQALVYLYTCTYVHTCTEYA